MVYLKKKLLTCFCKLELVYRIEQGLNSHNIDKLFGKASHT